MASSTKAKRRSAAQLAADGFAALVQKLGMAEALRYVQLYQQGSGDYSRERHQWLDEVGHERIAGLMAKTPKTNGPGGKRKKGQTAGRQAKRMS
jgi:hypothetical protein